MILVVPLRPPPAVPLELVPALLLTATCARVLPALAHRLFIPDLLHLDRNATQDHCLRHTVIDDVQMLELRLGLSGASVFVMLERAQHGLGVHEVGLNPLRQLHASHRLSDEGGGAGGPEYAWQGRWGGGRRRHGEGIVCPMRTL